MNGRVTVAVSVSALLGALSAWPIYETPWLAAPTLTAVGFAWLVVWASRRLPVLPVAAGGLLTFFVLDCIATPELSAALDRLRAALRPGGRWLLADFRPARRGWRRWLLAAMFWVFRLTTRLRARELPDFAAALAARGLRGKALGRFYLGATEAVVFQ